MPRWKISRSSTTEKIKKPPEKKPRRKPKSIPEPLEMPGWKENAERYLPVDDEIILSSKARRPQKPSAEAEKKEKREEKTKREKGSSSSTCSNKRKQASLERGKKEIEEIRRSVLRELAKRLPETLVVLRRQGRLHGLEGEIEITEINHSEITKAKSKELAQKAKEGKGIIIRYPVEKQPEACDARMLIIAALRETKLR